MTPSRAMHMEGPGGLGASYVSDTDTKEEGKGSRSFQNGPATRELQKGRKQNLCVMLGQEENSYFRVSPMSFGERRHFTWPENSTTLSHVSPSFLVNCGHTVLGSGSHCIY